MRNGKIRFDLYLPPTTFEDLKGVAGKEKRSLTKLIEVILDRFLEEGK